MDKHEYEINQLINPKKDIVKSNSKHRDKIETLIQGRRIGGIVGGGSTPSEKPYFAFDMVYGTGPIIRVRNGKANVLGDTTAQLCHIWSLSNGNMIIGSKPTISDVKNSYLNKFPLNPLNIIEWGIIEETETTFDLSLVEIIS